MKTGDHVHVPMEKFLAWLHAHHDVRNVHHVVDMYEHAGLNPVHKRTTRRQERAGVMLEVLCPRKYLAAKLRYGI